MEGTEPIVRRRRERQFRTTEENRLIVEATRRASVSVAAIAHAHGVTANQVFYWRKLYDEGWIELTLNRGQVRIAVRSTPKHCVRCRDVSISMSERMNLRHTTVEGA